MSSETLYQVVVEDAAGLPKVVGPAIARSVCEKLAHTIAKAIRAGKEREWFNPHIIEVPKVIHKRPAGPWADGLALN